MNNLINQALLIILLVGFNGFFAMAEIALITVKHSRLKTMKKKINLSFLLLAIILFSCNKENRNQIPEKVILSGKVLNHTSEIKNIFLSINRPGLGPLQVYTSNLFGLLGHMVWTL